MFSNNFQLWLRARQAMNISPLPSLER